MPVAASSRSPVLLEEGREGGWWLRGWASHRIVAATTSRQINAATLLQAAGGGVVSIEAEQVHGGSVAIIPGLVGRVHIPVPGCDALITNASGVALLIRTADCLPIFFADASRGVVGLAHAGWRGLAAQLPARVVAACRHAYQSRAEELQVAIGPAIRRCCYEVGPEFAARFGPFIGVQEGRRTCDLVGVAVDQLRRCGVDPARIVDTQRCTACETTRWFSLRREGSSTGRLTSIIMVRPSVG